MKFEYLGKHGVFAGSFAVRVDGKLVIGSFESEEQCVEIEGLKFGTFDRPAKHLRFNSEMIYGTTQLITNIATLRLSHHAIFSPHSKAPSPITAPTSIQKLKASEAIKRCSAERLIGKHVIVARKTTPLSESIAIGIVADPKACDIEHPKESTAFYVDIETGDDWELHEVHKDDMFILLDELL